MDARERDGPEGLTRVPADRPREPRPERHRVEREAANRVHQRQAVGPRVDHGTRAPGDVPLCGRKLRIERSFRRRTCRGNELGPDLTKIHERGREWLLTSIIQPARDVAPAYRQWQIVMNDGRAHVGVSLRKGSHSEDYLGADGKTFSVKLAEMESRSEIDTSMMPEGLPQSMTVKELRDVMAFLLRK